ncbi:MAG: hypothetical protein K2N38_02875 [Oscillospiraceae bacterium]|nr:hypothetical protein [Oscillospiraceae bacterium]
MRDETELVKLQILSTGRAEMLLEQEDYLIVKWTLPKEDGSVEIKYSFNAYAYSKTGMGNNYPWQHNITAEQAEHFLENIDEAEKFFKSKHHFFHTEIKEISCEEIESVDEDGVKFKDELFVTYNECVFNFARKHPSGAYQCIGDRDMSSDPPYIELYSTYCHVRIMFDRKGEGARKDNISDCQKMTKQIQKYGYDTFDLS